MKQLCIHLLVSGFLLLTGVAESTSDTLKLRLGDDFCFSEVWIDGEFSEVLRCSDDMLKQETAQQITLSIPSTLTLLEFVKTTEHYVGNNERTQNTIGLYAPFARTDFETYGLEYSYFAETPRFANLGIPSTNYERFALLDLADVDLCVPEVFPNGFIRALDVWARNWLHKSDNEGEGKAVEVFFQLRAECIRRVPSHTFLIPHLSIGSIIGPVHAIDKLYIFESFFASENAAPSPRIQLELIAETLDAKLLPEGAQLQLSGTYKTITLNQVNAEILTISVAKTTTSKAVLEGNCNNSNLYIYDATGKPHGFLPPPRRGRNADIVFRRPRDGRHGTVHVIDNPLDSNHVTVVSCRTPEKPSER